MIAVIQRVSRASVRIENQLKGSIEAGLLVLLGIENADGPEDVDWLCRKVANLRIFDDEGGVMNKSVLDVKGEVLLISQFTLHASTKKGNRPSYIRAAKPDVAIPLYQQFIKKMEQELGKPVQTGSFGALMDVELVNTGPVTIVINTKDKK